MKTTEEEQQQEEEETYRMVKIAHVKNVKQGIHHVEDMKDKLMEELNACFEGLRPDKRFSGKQKEAIR